MKFSLNKAHPRLLNIFFIFLMVFINLKLYFIDLLVLAELFVPTINTHAINYLSISHITILSLLLLFLSFVYIHTDKSNPSNDNNLLDLYRIHKPISVCTKCVKAVIPKISRHCIWCNTCTLVHEHHCPWLNVCIG